ncbi:MAG: GntR family transcriptional regulator [Lachnospiraceae bacterium]|nr:GntR family transcriptional regulator [Lachnospiraceae bacterium]
MIILDYKDRRPLYEQIVDKFSDMILKGILKPDEKMPSVRNLAMELSINPNTIQRAYMELERKGFVYSVKGRGNFVSGNDYLKEERKQEIKAKLTIHLKEAYSHGIRKEEVEQLIGHIYDLQFEETESAGRVKKGIENHDIEDYGGGKHHD